MGKVTQVNEGDLGSVAREAWNEAMKTAESNSTLTGDGTSASPLALVLLDEDDFASDSATLPASQQSIKAYIDAQIAAMTNNDAFGRQRVSNPETVFDSKMIHDNQPLFWDDSEVSGSGTTSTYNTNQASVDLDVGATTAGKRVRQTFMKFNYQPGKSQLLLLTGVMGSPSANNTAQIGFGDDDNGLFFYRDGSTVGVRRRTYTSGAAVDTDVAQASWDDPMDGTGESGVTVDWTKTQIFVIDFEWLGVGSVRFGLNIAGTTYYVHQLDNSNVNALVYMTTPNLPLRYEIENDGAGAADTLVHICSTVISEGGTQPTGQLRYVSTAGTHISSTTENIVYALIGIRLKAANLDGIVELIENVIDIQTTTDTIEWKLILNPTVAGSFTYNDQTNSVVQIATGATANTVTNGTDLAGGFIRSGNNGSGLGTSSAGLKNAIRLGAAIDGTVDEIVLCFRPVDGSAAVDVEASLTWREL